MNNEITKLLDIITPEIFNQYMDEYTAEKSAFVQSGIAVADERVSKNITSGGLLVNMPFWTDLSGEDEVLGDGDKALTTGKIKAANDVAAVYYRGRGWAVNEMAAVISGDDPMKSLLWCVRFLPLQNSFLLFHPYAQCIHWYPYQSMPSYHLLLHSLNWYL